MTTLSFSAALLVGGKSARMGQDKALLPAPGPELLWQRQLRTLRELQPREILWSGPPRPGRPDDIRIVPDALPSAGPLAGVSACLDVLRSDLLVVLAVDLPQINFALLAMLLSECSTGCGAVVQRGDFFEPLAAVYPRQARDLAADHLRQGRRAMQGFVGAAIKQDLLQVITVAGKDDPLFKNLNSPGDLAGLF